MCTRYPGLVTEGIIDQLKQQSMDYVLILLFCELDDKGTSIYDGSSNEAMAFRYGPARYPVPADSTANPYGNVQYASHQQ